MGNDFDLDSLASEADQYYQGVMNGRYDYDSFWRRLNDNSLERIEEMITDYEQKLSKLEKMSSSKLLKKHKIEISKNYLKSQLIELRAVREAKMGIKRQNEEADKVIEKINQKTEALKRLNNYLYSLFPRNYFLSQQKKDDFIPQEFDSIPYNVTGKYDNGNDFWNEDNNKEWIKAFHGTGRNCKNENEIKEMINSIFQNGFKNGFNNVHAFCQDKLHPGNRIGNGVYVTPNINTAKNYAGSITLNGKKYLTLFLVKVKKRAIRACRCPNASDYWVVNGTSQEIRPVKILFAEY